MRQRCQRPEGRAARSSWPALLLVSLLAASWLSARSPAQEPAAQVRDALPEGVTPEVQLAIDRGIGFLLRTQAGDGSWVGEQGTYPVAMTALAGLALLSSGSTATCGPYDQAIRRAEDFLLRAAGSDGLFSSGYEEGSWNEQRPMFGHAFSMMFLAQVLGQEESLQRQGQIRAALRKAVDLTIRAQSDAGGWYYTPESRRDEGTLTVTMMQGLRACRDAGIHVPKRVIDGGVKYIESSVSPSGAVYYMRSSQRQQTRHGVTCAAVVALWSAGRYDDPLLKRIVGYMDQNIRPSWGSYGNHATYVQFYLGQARFLLGGDRWTQFYRREAQLLVQGQEGDGGWLTEEERSMHGVGAVYSTSIALLVLQLPFNRLPIFQR